LISGSLFFPTGNRNDRFDSNVGRLRHESKESPYVNSQYNRQTTMTQDRSRGHLLKSPSSGKSQSPTTSSTPLSEATAIQIVSGERIRKTKDIAELSSPSNRKKRRYKFAVRKNERSERQRGGKKTFYLTLNAKGIPYGPGKLAWIVEVNKLASWLDPSCTHIRKQTYEDMSILKD